MRVTALKEIFRQFAAQGYTNIVLIDSDVDFHHRAKEIENAQDYVGEMFPYFLFPNPEIQSPGNLETLLENIIHADHKIILNCWQNYISCLKDSLVVYRLPDAKAKFYSYFSLNGENTSPAERNYRNKALWSLDHEYLAPLRAFLNKHLQAN